jgi:hypothetical protein
VPPDVATVFALLGPTDVNALVDVVRGRIVTLTDEDGTLPRRGGLASD